jgi:hypothetical protein
MKELKNQRDLDENLSTGYKESNRKTRAFYVTLGVVVGLFIGNKWWGDAADIISQIIQLSSIYIGGLTVTDSVRYYKYGAKTLMNPELATKELQDRYGDK